MNKNILYGVVGLVVLGVIFFIGKSLSGTSNLVGSAVGTTFSTGKIAAANLSLAVTGATSTSILNTDGSDRWVSGAFTYCTGASASSNLIIANLLIQAATTSAATPTLVTNTNLAANLSVSTTTTFSSQSSTTIGAGVLSNWAAGSYMTFFSNATNTAACTVGVSYIPS
jgi:hypothetical protein